MRSPRGTHRRCSHTTTRRVFYSRRDEGSLIDRKRTISSPASRWNWHDGPLYQDPRFTFPFAGDRFIPRFRLEGVEAGRRVSVSETDPGTGERPGLLVT